MSKSASYLIDVTKASCGKILDEQYVDLRRGTLQLPVGLRDRMVRCLPQIILPLRLVYVHLDRPSVRQNNNDTSCLCKNHLVIDCPAVEADEGMRVNTARRVIT